MHVAARTPASSQCWRPGIASGGPSSGPTGYISPLIACAVNGVIFQSRSGPVAPNGVSRHVTTDAGHQLSPSGSATKPTTGVAAVGEATTTSTVAASSASSGRARSSVTSRVTRRHPAAYQASNHAPRRSSSSRRGWRGDSMRTTVAP